MFACLFDYGTNQPDSHKVCVRVYEHTNGGFMCSGQSKNKKEQCEIAN